MKYKMLINMCLMFIFVVRGECGIFTNVYIYTYNFLMDNQKVERVVTLEKRHNKVKIVPRMSSGKILAW